MGPGMMSNIWFNSVGNWCGAIVSGESVVQHDFAGAGEAAYILLIIGILTIFLCIVIAA